MKSWIIVLAVALASRVEDSDNGFETAEDVLSGSGAERKMKRLEKQEEANRAAYEQTNFRSPLADLVRRSTDFDTLSHAEYEYPPAGIIPMFRQEFQGFAEKDGGMRYINVPPPHYPPLAEKQTTKDHPVFIPPPFYTKPPLVENNEAPKSTERSQRVHAAELLSGQETTQASLQSWNGVPKKPFKKAHPAAYPQYIPYPQPIIQAPPQVIQAPAPQVIQAPPLQVIQAPAPQVIQTPTVRRIAPQQVLTAPWRQYPDVAIAPGQMGAWPETVNQLYLPPAPLQFGPTYTPQYPYY